MTSLLGAPEFWRFWRIQEKAKKRPEEARKRPGRGQEEARKRPGRGRKRPGSDHEKARRGHRERPQEEAREARNFGDFGESKNKPKRGQEEARKKPEEARKRPGRGKGQRVKNIRKKAPKRQERPQKARNPEFGEKQLRK